MRTSDQAEERSLACAVGPDEAADLLFRDVKADVFKRRYAAKVLGQLLDFQNTHVYSSSEVVSSGVAGKPGVPARRAFRLVGWKSGFGLLEWQEPEEPSQESKQAIRLKQDDDNQ